MALWCIYVDEKDLVSTMLLLKIVIYIYMKTQIHEYMALNNCKLIKNEKKQPVAKGLKELRGVFTPELRSDPVNELQCVPELSISLFWFVFTLLHALHMH